MEIQDDLKYTQEHEWLKIEGNIATLGITDFAQNNLGDIVYVECPEVDTVIEAQEAVGSLESVKAVSEFYSPIAGTIVEVNKELEEQPELVNSSCYDQGWLVKIKIDPADLDQAELMDAIAYRTFAQAAEA